MSVLEEFSQELVILSTRLIGEKVLFTDTEGMTFSTYGNYTESIAGEDRFENGLKY